MRILIYFLGLVVAVLIAAVGELVSDEIRARLDRIPLALLAAAARRLPPEQRAELYEQAWLPELQYVLRGDEAMPITRVIHGIRYAFRLWVSASKISRELTARQSTPRLVRPSLGVVLIAGPLPTVALVASFAVKSGSWGSGIGAAAIAAEGYLLAWGARLLLLRYLGYWPNATRWCPCRWASLSRAAILPSALAATCAAAVLPLLDQKSLWALAVCQIYIMGTAAYFYFLRMGYAYRLIYMIKSLLRGDAPDTASTA
jgi:hypothetical protein